MILCTSVRVPFTLSGGVRFLPCVKQEIYSKFSVSKTCSLWVVCSLLLFFHQIWPKLEV